MRGTYVLAVEVRRPAEVRVGKLGVIRFPPGFYAYVGSALGGLEARIGRHLGKREKLHWHIDYLLSHPGARVRGVYVREAAGREECRVAGALAARFPVVEGFGASDCRCRGHLFRCDPRRLERVMEDLGFEPYRGAV